MIVIGLDLSLLSTGVCILSGDGEDPVISSFVIPQPQAKTEKEKLERLIWISSKVIKTVKEQSPDVVVVEAPARNQVWQMAMIGEVHGQVKVQLYLACGIVPMVEQATRLRKHVVGSIARNFEKVIDSKGKIKKKVNYGMIPGKKGKMRAATVKDVIEMRLKERDIAFASQDEMDAYVCAKFGWDHLRGLV
jgi:hypothetical protein